MKFLLKKQIDTSRREKSYVKIYLSFLIGHGFYSLSYIRFFFQSEIKEVINRIILIILLASQNLSLCRSCWSIDMVQNIFLWYNK